MSQSSTEARDTAVTTATALSLDTKTESKLKQDLKTKTDSKSKTESGNKVQTKGKTQSESKTASQTQSKSKSDSGSKDAVKREFDPNMTLINKLDSSSKVTELKMHSNSDSISKPESMINRLESESHMESSNKDGSDNRVAGVTPEQEPNSGVGFEQDLESANNPDKGSESKTPTKGGSGGSESAAKGQGSKTPDKAQDKGQGSGSKTQETPQASPTKEAPPLLPPGSDTTASKEGEGKQSGEQQQTASGESVSPKKGKAGLRESAMSSRENLPDDTNPYILPTKNNPLYNATAALEKLDAHPLLKMRRDGKYYLKVKDIVVETHPKVKRNKRGDVIPTIKKESMGAIERVVSRFCEDVLCISRAQFLPLSSQGERHLIWVGKKKANHIIRFLNGNGCYVVNRFPGDIFMKDKQVMGIILREHMLMRSNHCYWKCGVPKEDILNPKKENEDDEEPLITYRICRHMVKTMHMDDEGCEDKGCYNFEKHTCKHLDVFIPEVQSFCTYNALQDFSNRLDDDLKGQTFVCKPAYLYKGYGFRFFRTAAEFQEFYHMTEGKETSRHDFMVQRLIDKPFLYNNKKVDIRAFLLVVVLRYRRVISFIHYGFCRVANIEFEVDEEEDEVKIEDPLTEKELAKKKAEEYEKDMAMFVCTYRNAEEKRDRIKRMETQAFYDQAEDRSQELSTVFAKDEEQQNVKEQIRHIGIRLSQAIENKVWDAFGCFQVFGLDLCVDEDMKVWLIEVNSHAMSDVDTLSPTQRKVVPAVIMEALGLVVETTYKSFHHLRLRKSPTNEFEETGFLFRQNYDFIFSTLAKKRTDYIWPKPPKKKDPPFYERIGVVDEQIKNVEKRKKACLAMKIAVREEQLALKRKRNAKDEEES